MRHRFAHTISVWRQPHTITDRKRDKGLSEVASSVRCLIEPRPSVETRSQMGRISQGDHVVTWGVEDIRANDTVVWGERRFIVERVIPDVSRPGSSIPPYNVAELSERATG